MKFAFFIGVIIIVLLFKENESLSSIEAVRRFFRYFKVHEPMGLPVLEPPEPMSLPRHLDLIPVSIHEGKLYGHSKTRFKQLELNFGDLTGSFKCSIPLVVLEGRYSWPGIFSSSISEGKIESQLINVDLFANFSMTINSQDILQIVDFDNELISDELDLNMTDLNWEQQLILDSGSIHTFLFQIMEEITRQIKPLLLEATNSYIEDILRSVPPAQDGGWRGTSIEFSSPKGSTKKSHVAFFLRRILQYFGADPLRIPDMKMKEFGLRFEFSRIQLEGLSYIGYIQSLRIVYQEEKIYIVSSMTYPHLLAKAKMLLKAFMVRSRRHVTLDMEDAQLRIHLVVDPSQKEPPKLTDFDLRIGAFKNLKKARNSNLFKKIYASSVKNIFNYFVAEMKGSIKNVIQEKLNKVRLEEAAVQFLLG